MDITKYRDVYVYIEQRGGQGTECSPGIVGESAGIGRHTWGKSRRCVPRLPHF